MIRDKNSENPINAGQKSLVETVSSNLFVPIQPTIDCCYISNAGTKITKEADYVSPSFVTIICFSPKLRQESIIPRLTN